MDKTSNKYYVPLICIVLALINLAVYLQVLKHDFIDFDDDLYVTKNTDVQSGLTLKGIEWAFTTNQAYNWHPLTWISHMLDCQFYNLNPAGHHFTNVIFHVANTLFLFLVFKRMTGTLWRSAFVAALFALHPLHVESVAWVSERKDVLSTFFLLLTMWAYVRYCHCVAVPAPKGSSTTAKRTPGTPSTLLRTSGVGAKHYYLLVIVFFALGLMAKQMLVTLPFVLLLLDYWPLQRFTWPLKQKKRKDKSAATSLSRCFVEKVPLLALSFIASLIVLYVQSKATLVRSTIQMPIALRIANAILAYAKYIIKMFWPVHLGILYPYPQTNIQLWQVLTAGLLLLCITAIVFRLSRNRRWLIVGWLWYLGTLVPVIGFVQVGLQAMADRYTYVPFIGLFIIITWGAAELIVKLKYRNIIFAAGAGMVLLVLLVLTWLQLSHWKNSITLFEHTAAVTANNDIMHYNLGCLLIEQGKTDQAIQHWLEAVRIGPNQPTIHNNLAILFAQQGKIEQAIQQYRQVLKYRPNDAAAYNNLNALLAVQEKSAAEDKTPK